MPRDDLQRALAELERFGLLLLQDARLPNLAALIAGETVRGSWWGHPAGKRIYAAAEALGRTGGATTFKLVGDKVTFVHARLLPALVALGRAREPWQLDRLDAEALSLLARVDDEGRVRASGPPAKELERRLLVASEQVHTDSGKHATELVSWTRFAKVHDVRPLRSLAVAKRELESAADALGEAVGGRARLPWMD